MAKSYVLSGFVELEIPAPLKEVQTPVQHDKRLWTEHSAWCEKSESIWGQEDDMRGSAPIQLFLENPPSSKGTAHCLTMSSCSWPFSPCLFLWVSMRNVKGNLNIRCSMSQLKVPSFLNLTASLVTQVVKNLPAMQETWVRSLGWEDPLEKEMTTHSSILAWRIPWTEEPGGLQSMGSQRVRYNWATNT